MKQSYDEHKKNSNLLNVADQVLDIIKDHGLTPSPRNYELWFSYLNHDNSDLVQSMNVLFNKEKPFNDQLCDDLYDKHFNRDEKRIADGVSAIGDEMQLHLDDLIESIGTSHSDTSKYGQTLALVSSKLDNTDSPTKAVLETLIEATHRMKRHSAVLEEKLLNTTNEVRELQSNLKAVRQEALTDQLSGLANRRAFDETLLKASAHAAEDGTPLSLLVCDIDHFKKFNDTWGHQTGDNVLKLVASILHGNVKGQDTAARYGGEEFAIILPNTNLDGAKRLGETIRHSIAQKKLKRKNTEETLGAITISVGAAVYRPNETIEEFVHRADSFLYEAKKAGRNRVMGEAD